MPIHESPPHWVENKREDGMVIAEALGGWVVLPGDDRLAIAACPCCNIPFATARHAMLVADAVYPMAEAVKPDWCT